ncbi:class I SAM-dependent methyltransferase [Aggregatimonas sangjinii]|nr:class I SAM-dependent methyltransferase [Aggregatimonas sangjinii]
MDENDLHFLTLRREIIKAFGYDLKPDNVILDFGCGAGRTVQDLRDFGYQGFGCDIEFKEEEGTDTKSLRDSNTIRPIKWEPYELPFDDATFDVIFSDQVFEHVQNYPEAIAELERVLKPDGCCLHVFPSRYKPIESHVFVPFASIIRSYGWLYFWALTGIRNEFQGGLSAKETAKKNHHYLHNYTTYFTKNKLFQHFKEYFQEVVFCENLFLKYSKKGRFKNMLFKSVPFFSAAYRTFSTRVIFTRGPLKS